MDVYRDDGLVPLATFVSILFGDGYIVPFAGPWMDVHHRPRYSYTNNLVHLSIWRYLAIEFNFQTIFLCFRCSFNELQSLRLV